MAECDWLYYEKACILQGFETICGIDEAGRGPLAGPVYAAAVVLPKGVFIEGINDSKKLSEKKREEMFDKIIQTAEDYCIASASVEEIDSLNILNATFLAMRRAFDGLARRPDCALIDGNLIRGFDDVSAFSLVKGDAKCASIAAASILAKVSRDRYMRELAEKYPLYGFEKHKGYGTALHTQAIQKYGILPVHRKSFLKKFL